MNCCFVCKHFICQHTHNKHTHTRTHKQYELLHITLSLKFVIELSNYTMYTQRRIELMSLVLFTLLLLFRLFCAVFLTKTNNPVLCLPSLSNASPHISSINALFQCSVMTLRGNVLDSHRVKSEEVCLAMQNTI